MRVSVSASIHYYYEVEVDNELCACTSDGDLINEAQLLEACYDADPISVKGNVDVGGFIESICNDETGEMLYAN